jgi:hypothetical protein
VFSYPGRLQQPRLQQASDQVHKVLANGGSVDIIVSAQPIGDGFNIAKLNEQFPHVRADIVEAKILLAFHVQQDDFVLQSLINDVVAWLNSRWRHNMHPATSMNQADAQCPDLFEKCVRFPPENEPLQPEFRESMSVSAGTVLPPADLA